MTRRRWLWVLGVASLGLFGGLAWLDTRMVDAGGWGIVDFELAGSRHDVQRIVADWGAKGHDAARWSLWLDYAYLVVYGAFGALAVAAVRDLARRREWRRLAGIGRFALAFPIAAAACDALEDAGLLLSLDGHGGTVAPVAATAFAIAKFALLTLTVIYVVAGLVRAAWARRRVATAAVLGVVALALASTLVSGLSAARETEAARPGGGGQVLRLPGGDLYVTDSGPRTPGGEARARGPVPARGTDALVLIHGYTGSTRWWSRVMPALSRAHRTIAVDLLGHGRSEKPRDGYEMENQARLVLAALRRLGVRRAVVAGHSMGGWVAVSMAEQDPELVRGVATIATPADRPEGPGPLGDRLSYVPVVGPASWNAVPDAYVRAKLRSAFADGVPVPDEFVADTRGLTWRAYARSAIACRDFREDDPPYARMAGTGLPFLAIVGAEDDRVKAESSREWTLVPRGRVVRMRHTGHTPPWERPSATATALTRFADPLLRRP
jgi:pimeloyl-ACP methyl ester carboxylesterase